MRLSILLTRFSDGRGYFDRGLLTPRYDAEWLSREIRNWYGIRMLQTVFMMTRFEISMSIGELALI